MGFAQTFMFVPTMPEMIERMQIELNIVEGKDEVLDSRLNDKINDMYGFTYSLAMFIAPLVGSNIYTYYGAA